MGPEIYSDVQATRMVTEVLQIIPWAWLAEDSISHDGSMYGIYVNIGGILMVNVAIYLHGSYGYRY